MQKPESKTTNQTRNLHPHAEAIVAMLLWGEEYSEQGGGSMDFYDGLSEARKRQCASVVNRIIRARRAL